MDLDDILYELNQNRGYFPQEAVEEAIRLREQITPHLLQALGEAAEQVEAAEEEETPFLPVYALFLLAQFRDRCAYPLVIQLCKLPGDGLYDLIGDMVTEGLASIIASVFDGDVTPIKSIIEDASLDEYVRGTAIRALAVLAWEGPLARTDVTGYLAELFQGKLEREVSQVWNALASEAVELHATDLVDDIRQAYAEELIGSFFMDMGYVEEMFALPEEAALAQAKEKTRGLTDDVVGEMRGWACFKPEKAPSAESTQALARALAARDDRSSVVRSEPKVGRNAPCPCGSGKKYKRCCGAG